VVEITEAAEAALKQYFEQNNFDIDAPVRVRKHTGCGGTSLALAFDDPGPGDKTFTRNGMNFIVDEGLLGECGSIKIDFAEPTPGDGCGCSGGGGLSITSANPIAETTGPGGGCGCSSSGSCGS